MNDAFVSEIIRWSRNSMFTIEPSWLSSDVLNKILPEFQLDYQNYYPNKKIEINQIKYFPGLTATLLYRISRACFLNNEEQRALEFSSLARFLTGIELYYSANIGKSLKINHGAGLVVGARVTMGDNCLLHQNITLGDRIGGRPVIGNNVSIYPGSSVLGAVHIGSNVIIGANTLVLTDIADNKTVVGNPNRIFDGKN
jgi:serine O-acetyltransferase